LRILLPFPTNAALLLLYELINFLLIHLQFHLDLVDLGLQVGLLVDEVVDLSWVE